MTRLLFIAGIGILGYVGATYYQTGRVPSLPDLVRGGGSGAFAGGYGLAVDGARSVGGSVKGLAGEISNGIGN